MVIWVNIAFCLFEPSWPFSSLMRLYGSQKKHLPHVFFFFCAMIYTSEIVVRENPRTAASEMLFPAHEEPTTTITKLISWSWYLSARYLCCQVIGWLDYFVTEQTIDGVCFAKVTRDQGSFLYFCSLDLFVHQTAISWIQKVTCTWTSDLPT